MKVISFINEKGGTGKTTLAVNLAAYYALKRGKKVLLVDLDSQGQAGKSLGVAVRDAELTIFELLTHTSLDPRQAVQPTRIKKLDILCSNKRLSDLPERLARHPDRALRLRNCLMRLDPGSYDYIVIDSPPSLGLVTTNILAVSTDLVVPVALTYLSLDGCAEVLQSMETIRTTYPESTVKLGLVVPTMYRNTRLANEIVAKLAQYFPDRLSKTVLGFNVKIDEAQSFGKTIWEYEPEGRGALMLESVAVELFNKVLRYS